MVDDDSPETPDYDGEEAEAPTFEEVEALKTELAQLKDQALRIAAEAENTRRRAEKDVNDARAYAIQKFGRDLLEAADNLSRALQAAHMSSLAENANSGVKNLVVGIEMTEKALQTAFERNGLKRLEPARGDKFDPHKHQAVMEQPADDLAPGAVVGVMQSGYELFGRIVRPAMVAVTPKAAAAASSAAADAYAAQVGPNGAGFDTKA